ncbi:citrate (Si)-synthase, partial [Candidatus Roizmanbacteria bacterium]|nr:citrate (Si)-synthase [Candidatus Roizmanbacteria bacterium]
GQIPNAEELKDLQNELKAKSEVPAYVWSVIDAMPADSHPMVMFNTAVLIMQKESVFAKRYDEGMKKDEYWDATYEDAMNIIAKLPAIAAYVYRKRFNKGPRIEQDKNADWSGNYVHMLGLPNENDEFAKLMRLYLNLHSDHEGGNVSAYSSATISSALSDLYYSLSGGLNGLAGPLHGLANQECLGWLLDVYKMFGKVPSRDELYKFAWDTLNSGKVIPGYGHAVLRVPDPRYTAQMKFAKERFPQDDLVQLADMVFDVVPTVLREQGKAKNPAPNVDAISGTLQYYYGVREFDFYTVLFGVGRALGVTPNFVWARALGQPLERPKSLSTKMLEDIVKAAQTA